MFAPPPLPPGLDPALEMRGAHAHGFDYEDEDRDWPDEPHPAHLIHEHRWELRHPGERTPEERDDDNLILEVSAAIAFGGTVSDGTASAAAQARLRRRQRVALRRVDRIAARFVMHSGVVSCGRARVFQRGPTRAPRRGAARRRRPAAGRPPPSGDGDPPPPARQYRALAASCLGSGDRARWPGPGVPARVAADLKGGRLG